MEWFYQEVEGNQENECHNDVDIKRLAWNEWHHPHPMKSVRKNLRNAIKSNRKQCQML